jgi:AraC-like DNA-binding protein
VDKPGALNDNPAIAAAAEQPMQRLAFSSDDLPAHLDERARLALWHDRFPWMDVAYSTDRPFVARTDFLQFGDVSLIRMGCTFSHMARAPRHIAADGSDLLSITFNDGQLPWLLRQGRREATPETGAAAICRHGEPLQFRSPGEFSFVGVGVPRARLRALIGDGAPGGITLECDDAVRRHLRRYLAMLLGPDGIEEDPQLANHVSTTLVDLVALAVGVRGEAAHMARGRGLRAARVRQIAAEIERGFSDPAFSAATAATSLGLSARYVQDLLQETNATFTERVTELRLCKARKMLDDARRDAIKVAEVALACGFGDVPHFNRLFRRRFGCAPSDCRNGSRRQY